VPARHPAGELRAPRRWLACADRGAGLPLGREAAPTPATYPPKCWRTPAQATSSSAIPNAGRTMANATRRCASRPKPWRAPGCVAILCVGETLEQRDGGTTLEVIARQLEGSVPAGATAQGLIIAYEPVWAIGTGRTPTTEQVAEVHAAIAARMGTGFRILYGGSVKPSNAAELLAVPHVDGALVGGASLKAADFLAIAGAAHDPRHRQLRQLHLQPRPLPDGTGPEVVVRRNDALSVAEAIAMGPRRSCCRPAPARRTKPGSASSSSARRPRRGCPCSACALATRRSGRPSRAGWCARLR
jgi:hypothetical protein